MNLFKYYSKLSLPARAGIWFLVCSFLQKGISALTTPIFTRILSTSEYGRVSVYYSWQDIFFIFITFGLSSTVYSRGLIKYEEDKDSYTQSMVSLTMFISVIAFCLYMLFHTFINRITGLSLYSTTLIYVYSFFSSVIEFWSQKKRVDYVYRPFVIVTILLTLIKPAVAICCIYFLELDSVFIRITSDAVLMFLFGIPILLFLFKTTGSNISYEVWKESLLFVIPLIPHYLSQRILNQSDRIMISRMSGDSEAGIYSLAYSVGMLLMLINTAVDSTLSPWIFRKLKEKSYEAIRKMNNHFVLLFALCTICFTLITPELVKIFASEEYSEAINIVPIISISSYFIFLYVQFIYMEYFVGKTQYIAIVTVLSALINFGANLIFIQKYGYYAAAYTTLVCYILYAIGHYCIMKYICRSCLQIKAIYDGKKILLISGIVLLMVPIALFLYRRVILRIVILSVYIAILFLYVIYMFNAFGMEKNR